jgi:hypothetical protein
MSRLSAWLAITAVVVAMLSGSAWAWAQVPADVVLSMHASAAETPSSEGFPTQLAIFPFFCHW